MNPFNLLIEKWIPVKRQSGERLFIAPYEIVNNFVKDPIVELAAPRPDFNAAIAQFLIGLIQTTFPPKNPSAWRKYHEDPPSEDDLQRMFQPFVFAFNLNGDGPRFMQDYDVKNYEGSDPKSIRKLLIDAPGQQTEDKNADLFIKRVHDFVLCTPAAALALMTIQMFAPIGGGGREGGHRSSLRGAGALTTIFVGKTLWEGVWLNVMESRHLGYSTEELAIDKHLFPWLGPTIVSDRNRLPVVEPIGANFLPSFWGCPRRIRLLFAEGICNCAILPEYSITVNPKAPVCSEFVTLHYGPVYSSNWRHPLSPYLHYEKEGLSFARVMETPDRYVSFRDWLKVAVDTRVAQAATVLRINPTEYDMPNPVRVVCFGYAVRQQKALNWINSELPFFVIPLSKRERVHKELEAVVEAANRAGEILKISVKSVWERENERGKFRKGVKVKKESSASTFAAKSTDMFYKLLDPHFFIIAKKLADAVNGEEVVLKEEWISLLRNESICVFDKLFLSGDLIAVNHLNVFCARSRLRKTFIKQKEVFRRILELPLSKSKDIQRNRIKSTSQKEVAV